MPEPQYVVALIIAGLGAVAFLLIASWAKGWETRLTAQDSRLDKHDDKHGEHEKNHVKLDTNLTNLTKTVEETHRDVKELLKQNGKRNTA